MIFIGMLFKSYCDGYFGRDADGEKRVEAFGADWIVCRMYDGSVVFAQFQSTALMLQYVKHWQQENE